MAKTAPKVSIITPTIREKGLKLIDTSLQNQTFKDYEWLIGSPFEPKGLKTPFRWIKDDYKGGFWSLNRIYNELFRQSQGKIIVTWQDFIWTYPNGLEKFVLAVDKKDAVVSGVGDQFTELDRYGKPVFQVWGDPRRTEEFGSFYECFWEDCEWNWAAFPKEAVYEVGGMDEELDFLGYGGDQYQICERMADIGVRFFLDQTNESRTLRHGRVKDWDQNHVLLNGMYDKRKIVLTKEGKWPMLDYLK